MSDIWQDPRVKDALNDGRRADDIAVLDCTTCGQTGYYNQGSHFTCLPCDKTFYCVSENETPPDDGTPWLRLEDMRTLADTLDSATFGPEDE